MKEMIKEMFAITTVTGIFGVSICFGIYFTLWICTDPFDLISDGYFDPEPYTERKDVVICREKGGMAITSAWDGRLLNCQLN